VTTANHVATGAVIALAISNPVVAITLSFLSHFVLDAIPHFGPPLPKDVFERNRQWSFKLMLVLSIGITIFLVPYVYTTLHGVVSLGLLTACIIAANLPDAVRVPRFIQEITTHEEKPLGRFSAFHVRIQNDSIVLGAFDEIVWFIAMLILMIQFK
jgi:hypothetical protein